MTRNRTRANVVPSRYLKFPLISSQSTGSERKKYGDLRKTTIRLRGILPSVSGPHPRYRHRPPDVVPGGRSELQREVAERDGCSLGRSRVLLGSSARQRFRQLQTASLSCRLAEHRQTGGRHNRHRDSDL